MEGFMLLLGHLLGDFVFQNDWMAKNKVLPRDVDPREYPTAFSYAWHCCLKSGLICWLHCLVYTTCVCLLSPWIRWDGALVILTTHFFIDWYGLARKWMRLAGQEAFATGPAFPWSVIVVDNTFHLAVLGLVWWIG